MYKDKQQARKIAIERRNNIEFFSQKNCKITEKVIELLLSKKPSSVFCYVSINREVNTKLIIEKLFTKIEFFVPHTTNKTTVAVKLDSIDRLNNVDKWGNVYFPYEKVEPRTSPCEITLVPLVAFDEKCNRLGYGAGCYDKYFALGDTLKLGLAFDEQNEEFLVTEQDIPLDAIITPTRIIWR